MKSHGSVGLRRFVLSCAIAACAALISHAAAQSGPTVTTDKLDYMPGETAHITGSGFTGQPLIIVQVVHVPPIAPEDECAPSGHEAWEILADAEGNFTTQWYVNPCDGPGSTFLLTADDVVFNLHAEAIFTDQASLEALRNNSNPPAWAGNNINNPNACYAEGDSVPFRFFLTSLTAGQTYTFTIQLQALSGSRRGLDYLTDYDRTEAAAILAAGGPCGPTPLVNSNCTSPTGSAPFPDPSVLANYSGTIPAGSGYPLAIPLDGPRNLKYYNTSGVSFSNYSFSGNNLQLSVTFTATSTGVGFFWGGHLAKSSDWGSGNGASSVPGGLTTTATNPSPNGPNSQSVNINSNAISCVPPSCTISCPDAQPYLAGSTHCCSTPSVSGVTYTWTVTGGTITTGQGTNQICYTVGTVGSLTVTLRTCKTAAGGCPVDSCCTECSVNIPVQTCACTPPPDVTVECGGNTSPSATGAATCTLGCTSSSSDSVAIGMNCATDHIVRTISRTWTCSAGAASSTCVQTITVVDTTAPVISGVGGPATIQCPATPVFSSPTASDACGASSLTFADVTTPGSCANAYSTTRTWTATDACGNSSTSSQTISVVDTTPPTISAAGANATIECPDTPSFTPPTATDACDPAPVVSEVSDGTTPGSCPQEYSRTKTWKATDACGNMSATVSQTIYVVDTTPPVVSALPGPSTIECPASPSFATPTATDACGASTLTFTDATTAGSCANAYSTTRTWTATDACGNMSATASQTINVVDTTPPVISALPGPSTIECPATPSFATPTATDACGTSTLTSADVTTPGTCANAYSTTRTWTATDACGNSSTSSQTINVVDTTPPVISALPAPSTIECPASPSFATPTATDACGAETLTFVDSSSGTCPVVHVRTWTATDACGNSSTSSQTISVVDTTPSVISALPGPSTIECPATPSFATPTATDACDPAPSLTFVDSSSGICPVVHVRTWTATDACGNTSTASQTINVADTTAPVIDPLPDASTIECPATPMFATATASDTCSTATLTFVDSSSGTCPVVHVRTWTATDACNNTSTASQTINVADTTPPVISALPGPTTIECPASPSFATPTATDACGAATLNFMDATTAGSCANAYSRTRTWTATDACGNSSSASQTINVEDNTAPAITANAASQTVECDGAGNAAERAAWLANNGGATALDACSGITWSNNFTALSDDCGSTGSATVTFTATDACGHSSSTMATFSIVDNTAPVLGPCPQNMLIPCSVNLLVPVTFVLPGALDNCGAATVTSVPASGSFFPIGSTTVTCTATDACGNSSSCTFTVTRASLGFEGFLPPIGGADATGGSFNDPLRAFKLGSTIPVKFRSSCGGSPVLTGIHTLQAIKYSSATNSDPPVDATPTDAATTGNQFRLVDDQWHFNLSTKTANGFSAGIWKFIATLSDGSRHEVWITLKK